MKSISPKTPFNNGEGGFFKIRCFVEIQGRNRGLGYQNKLAFHLTIGKIG